MHDYCRLSCSPCFHSAAALILGGGFFFGVEDNARAENVTEKPNVQECVQETALRIVSRLLRPRIVSREGAMFWSGPGIMASGHVNRI